MGGDAKSETTAAPAKATGIKGAALRGASLVSLALRLLNEVDLWMPPNPPLRWTVLAARLGVTRGSLDSKPEIRKAFAATKEMIEKRLSDPSNPLRTMRSSQRHIIELKRLLVRTVRERDRFAARCAALATELRRGTIGYGRKRTTVG